MSTDASTIPGSDESTAWVVITVTVITMTIAMVALAARVYTRAVLVKQFGVDDWGAVIAGASLLLCGIWVNLNIQNGLGRHAWTLSVNEILDYFKYFYISIIWYNFTLVVVKLSFLAQYYRVFAVPKIRRIIIIAMVLIGCWSLSQVFVGIWICKPIAKFWNSALPGHCIPNIPQWYINAGGNIITDVTIFLLPMPVLKSLNLKRPHKIIVMGIFSLGFFTVAISIIRIKYLKQYADFSWENVASSCWSVGELSSAVTCLCLPTLKPLMQKLMPSTRTTVEASDNNYGYSRTARSGLSGRFRLGLTSKKSQLDSVVSSHNPTSVHDLGAGDVDGRRIAPTGSQDQLYSADLEMSLGVGDRKGSFGESAVSAISGENSDNGSNPNPTTTYGYATTQDTSAVDTTQHLPSAKHPNIQRELLGLRTTVTTKCAVSPQSAPASVDGDAIQVKHDVRTQSIPRK